MSFSFQQVGGGSPSPGTTEKLVEENHDALVTALDEDPAFAGGILNTPIANGSVLVFLNGEELEVGDGVKTKPCYFANPLTPSIPRAISDIAAGDSLRWMGSVAGYELSAADKLGIVYTIGSGSIEGDWGWRNAILDGGGAVLAVGKSIVFSVSHAYTIKAVRLLADVAGNIGIEFERCPFATYPAGFVSLTGGAGVALAAVQSIEDATLAGWTLNLVGGDVIRVSVMAAPVPAVITKVSAALDLER